jgi:hypothetical protein
MGWWSKDIMGGDSPLDVKDGIFDICGVDEFGEDGRDITRKDIEDHMPQILDFVRSHENNDYYDESAIAYQVLGVLMMKTGTPITEELKQEILENSKTDSWAESDSERKEIVGNFHTAIENYNGTPVVITSRGLFEAIAEHMSQGNTGLVNKGKGIG